MQPAAPRDLVAEILGGTPLGHPELAVRAIDRLLEEGPRQQASDLHLQPEPDRLRVSYRIDGVLQAAGAFPASVSPNLVARLKVLAGLLTYRTDVPQEGRIGRDNAQVELRVATFPTLYGERAVVRFFASARQYLYLDDLGLPADVYGVMRRLVRETSGFLLATGPAGSGKTTTAYACLREIVERQETARSLVSLEDPVEVPIAGVAQSQVNLPVGLDLETGLRFLMRQDPEVLLVGEIRDRATAEAAFQASLTGHLIISTFHAGSAAEAISRLADMGIEPYMLRSGLLGILSQRLVRRLCGCAVEAAESDYLGLPVAKARVPRGCHECRGTGYLGRFLLVEMLSTEKTELGRAILSRSDASALERLAAEAGMVTRWQRAIGAVEAGETSAAEIRRVLGFSGP